ncbi:hypothetical protein [Streptomyces atratus]|uniref:hypothetical protein n=1 Tax=Streptomyces atratus TaxID=1893 RepID=UPI00130066C0|nr:hypothetical protein [Streptomyces atratus]
MRHRSRCPDCVRPRARRLVRRVKGTVEAAPPTHHRHYNGDVVQDSRTITTMTRGVIANTRNQTC